MMKRVTPGYKRRSMILLVVSVLILSSLACNLDFSSSKTLFGSYIESINETVDDNLPGMGFGDASDTTADQPAEPAAGGSMGSDGKSGPLKPVGFVNYGEFNANVRPSSFIPLGKTESVTPPAASTISSANSGSGEWPNSSRFLSVPMGAYTWCIDWEEGDIDEDGLVDYFHYLTEETTILDENDSDELDLAEEVAISAPPSTGAVYEGKCQAKLADSACVDFNSEVNVYSLYAIEQGNPPDIKVAANAGDQAPPSGMEIASGGVSTGYGGGMILWQEGDWVEISTGDAYQAIGVQVHGDQTIGWARVLFDGQEIWRGDTSSHAIAEGRYGVYVEIRCFPTGTHTLRIEGLGQTGSGGGQSIPVSYFGFRE